MEKNNKNDRSPPLVRRRSFQSLPSLQLYRSREHVSSTAARLVTQLAEEAIKRSEGIGLNSDILPLSRCVISIGHDQGV